jgi:YgiT-type zinc finger domain-containing protein
MKVVPCNACDGKREFVKEGNIFHEINDKPILIIGIPHYFCESCGSIAYPSDSPIKQVLKYAYKEEFNVVIW